jgi:hypothetical protein
MFRSFGAMAAMRAVPAAAGLMDFANLMVGCVAEKSRKKRIWLPHSEQNEGRWGNRAL